MPNILWILIGLGFLLIPVADERMISFIPLYPFDYISMGIFIAALAFCWPVITHVRNKDFVSVFIVFGIFLLSTIFSFVVNDPSLTSLGQIKSWTALPGMAGLLLAYALRNQQLRDENIIRLWFYGSLFLLGIALTHVLLKDFTFDGRLEGPFDSPNFLAFFLFPGTMISFYLWQTEAQREKKFFLGIIGALFLYALFLTHSLGGFLALTLSVTWYVLRTGYYKRHAKKLFSLLFIALIFLSAEVLTNEKVINIFEERSSLASRHTIWSVALEMIQREPFSGIGTGNFQQKYLSYQQHFPPYLEWAVPQPHNLILALWLQAGLMGLLAMLWLIQKALRGKNCSQEQFLLQALFIGMLGYGIFDTPLFGNALGFVWWVLLAQLLFPIQKKEGK